mgnify:CR=1 FL=1
MTKRKKKKSKIKSKTLVLSAILCCTVLVLLIVMVVLSNHEYYSLSSRVDKVKREAKKEKNKKIDYQTMGWIRVQGTNIDYPIIQHIEDADEEDSYPVEKESYFWSRNSDDKLHNNILINGHNIFNLSSRPKRKSKLFKRAEELMSFVYYDFANENKYIQLTIDNHDYIYKIFSVAFIDGSDATFLPHFDDISSKAMRDYLDILNQNSIYDYDVDVNEKDKIISVVTCNRMFSDDSKEVLYINGRLLRDNEKINNYGVKKNKNYGILEDLWEDVEDEEV